MVTPIAAIQAGVFGGVIPGSSVSIDSATADGASLGSGARLKVGVGLGDALRLGSTVGAVGLATVVGGATGATAVALEGVTVGLGLLTRVVCPGHSVAGNPAMPQIRS
jgi:hypothetical protein